MAISPFLQPQQIDANTRDGDHPKDGSWGCLAARLLMGLDARRPNGT